MDLTKYFGEEGIVIDRNFVLHGAGKTSDDLLREMQYNGLLVNYLDTSGELTRVPVTASPGVRPDKGREKSGWYVVNTMGDKINAKAQMETFNVPCVPGSDGEVKDVDDAIITAKKIGFPVLLKAAAGGGGIGMKIIHGEDQLETLFLQAKSEAKKSFNDDTLYMEKYLEKPRHMEIQIFGDGKGKAVHLGERDCSLQRRHQKVLEETPSPGVTPEEIKKIGKICSDAVSKMKYEGAGTIEFLYENREFFFIEMNTRLQVEHPITEAVFGIDLVKEQIRVAFGMDMSLSQETLKPRGHAIECRINAERLPSFSPSPGNIKEFHSPGGIGIRMDSAIYNGFKVPPFYDSLIGKLIVHADSRPIAISRLSRAQIGRAHV